VGSVTFGPIASFQYTRIHINDFSERGSLAPLSYPDQSEDSKRSTVGLKLSHEFKVGSAKVKPEIRASWQHEYGDAAYPIDSRFASGAGNIFTVHGPEIGRDSALVGAGVGVQLNERVGTYVHYDGQLGRDNYDSHSVSGGLRISL
jgi:outer membrane autotransporter protein